MNPDVRLSLPEQSDNIWIVDNAPYSVKRQWAECKMTARSLDRIADRGEVQKKELLSVWELTKQAASKTWDVITPW